MSGFGCQDCRRASAKRSLSSGDICFRNVNWDAPAIEADFKICFKPVAETVDGRRFTGFKYWYNTNISLWGGEVLKDMPDGDLTNYETRLMTGAVPIDLLFRHFAHKRIPNFNLHTVPKEKWHAERVAQIQELFRLYKQHRHLMKKRTVLKGYTGVLWENDTNTKLFFSFVAQAAPWKANIADAVTGEPAADGKLKPNRAYLVS